MPDTKWTPANAPVPKQDFSKAAAPARQPRVASLQEKQALEKERERPVPALKPREPGQARNLSRDQQSKDREARIKQIQERLAAEKGKARGDFNKTRGR